MASSYVCRFDDLHGCLYVDTTYVCNNLTPQIKGMPEPIYVSHIALPTSLKNMVIGNGGSTFLMYTLHFSLLRALFIYKLWCGKLDILLDCWEVWYLGYANHPFYVLVIHILIFENSASIFGKYPG